MSQNVSELLGASMAKVREMVDANTVVGTPISTGDGTTLIGDVIESQFKAAYNPNLGAAMSLVLMILIFICVAVMNRFGEGEEQAVMM